MEQTVQSIKEIEIVLRNPEDKKDTLSYFIDIETTDFNIRWLDALKKNLKNHKVKKIQRYLEASQRLLSY